MATKAKRVLTWKSYGQNKWGLRISRDNYVFVVITPLEKGKFRLKYMDAELKDYTENEKEIARIATGIESHQVGKIALAVMEHYGYYEWIEAFNTLAELSTALEEQTSFELKHLKDLVPYEPIPINQ